MRKIKITNAMKYIFVAAIFTSVAYGCSKDCNNEPPRGRITNHGTGKASVQIQTSGGNTENINGIESGQQSEWRSYAEGQTEFTISIQGVSNDTLIVVNMLNCWEYDIVINSLNSISTSPQERE